MNRVESLGDTSISVPINTILVGDNGFLPRRSIWHYFKDDPNAVIAEFERLTDGDVTVFNHSVWGFSRDLSITGLYMPIGDGDVNFTPRLKLGQVSMRLSSPSGESRFLVPRQEMKDFLDQTRALVPQGTEEEHQRSELARAAAQLEILANER